MKSITINVTNTDSAARPNPIIIKKWLIDNLGVYPTQAIVNASSCGPGWCIDWDSDGKDVFWIITFKDDETAIEFMLRFL